MIAAILRHRRSRGGSSVRCTLPILLTLLLCVAGNAVAELTARLEPPVIDEFETTRLLLRSTGETTVQPLDLSALAGDFEVLGTQTSSQYRAVDGVIEAWVEYQVTLQPTRHGKLTIPSIAVGGERSAPLTLDVRGIDPELRAAIDRMAFFEVEVTPDPVYVRAEAVLARRLYYSAQTQIYSDLPGTPEVPDALVLPIGETRSGTVVRDGERYGVIEQRFALFPERAGTLTVPPISLTSSVRLPVAGRVRRTGARITSPALAIEVLPIPAEYPTDAPWLPARSVTLTDRWAPDRAVYRVGEAITRQVEVRVSGNLAAAVAPPLDRLPESTFRQYAEPAVLTDQRDGASVVGTRATAYSIIPTAPGSIVLPALTLTWWDVDAGRVRTAVGQAREVVIEGAAPAATQADQFAPAAGEAPVPEDPAAAAGPPDEQAWGAPAMRWLATAAASGALALALWWGAAWALPRRAALALRLRRGIARLGFADARRGPVRQLRLRRLRRRLARAGGDPAVLHGALLDYLRCWYATPAEPALARFRAAGYGPLLDRLLAARFGRAAAPAPAANELLAALATLPVARRPAADPLPELFGTR